MEKEKLIIKILRIATICVFLGRAIQLTFWSAPYSVFFWDESLLSPVVKRFGLDWSTYLKEVGNSDNLSVLVYIIAGNLFLGAIAAFFYPKFKKIGRFIILLATLQLFILALLYWKDNFWIIAQFIEYTLQWSMPLFFLAWFTPKKSIVFWLKVAIAFTFLGHGAYALGIFPIPGNFYGMVIKILGVNQESARIFLWIAGILDVVIVIGLFLPYRWSKWIIIYAIFWGLATTLARLMSHFYVEDLQFTLLRWGPEVLYRVPHFVGPLVLFMTEWYEVVGRE